MTFVTTFVVTFVTNLLVAGFVNQAGLVVIFVFVVNPTFVVDE